jgi:hypothetical protein
MVRFCIIARWLSTAMVIAAISSRSTRFFLKRENQREGASRFQAIIALSVAPQLLPNYSPPVIRTCGISKRNTRLLTRSTT